MASDSVVWDRRLDFASVSDPDPLESELEGRAQARGAKLVIRDLDGRIVAALVHAIVFSQDAERA
jgi:hypothetical protein